MNISTENINKFSYIYLSIPLIIFFSFWLNPIFSLISIIALFYILKNIFRTLKKGQSVEISKNALFFIIISATIWCFLSGIGGIHYQSPDWHLRNAIFNDLINYSFPVKYPNGSILIYYFGLMLPATLFGKVLSFLHINQETTFKLACLFNLLFCTVGVILCFLHTVILTKSKSFKKIMICTLIFIFFSGLDILFFDKNFSFLHIEWHFKIFQYSSFTTQLFWVYNQAILSWLICLIFLSNPYKISNFAFLGVLNLFYAPFCFLGMSIYFMAFYIKKFIQAIRFKKFKPILYKTFSLTNILSMIIIFPVIYSFYKFNTFTTDFEKYSILPLKETLFFFILEVGVYLVLIKELYKKNLLYYVTFFSLLIIPYIRFINILDYVMRTSIPALLILMILTIKYIYSDEVKHKKLLIAFLIIGAITPIMEIIRGFYYPYALNIPKEKNNIKTLNNKITEDCTLSQTNIETTNRNIAVFCNYGTKNYRKNILFKY